MTCKHYIRLDQQGRIIDGYSTYSRQPEEGDILLHEGGKEFELFEKRPNPALFFTVQGQKIYEYAYDNGQPRWRSKEELEADFPPMPPVPDTGTRLDNAEADIATLIKAFNIITGGG